VSGMAAGRSAHHAESHSLGVGLSQLAHLYEELPELMVPHLFADQASVLIKPPNGETPAAVGARRNCGTHRVLALIYPALRSHFECALGVFRYSAIARANCAALSRLAQHVRVVS
jgi:hypothetical protein